MNSSHIQFKIAREQSDNTVCLQLTDKHRHRIVMLFADQNLPAHTHMHVGGPTYSSIHAPFLSKIKQPLLPNFYYHLSSAPWNRIASD